MKILYLEPADFIGGAELFSIDILHCLPTHVSVLLLTGSNLSPFKIESNQLEVRMFPFPRLRPFRPHIYLQTLIRLRRLIRSEEIDLIHSNSVRAGLLAAFARVPFTHFAHDFTTPRSLAPVFNRARVIMCCSTAVKDDLIAKGVATEKLTVIPNGIVLRDKPRAKTISPIPTIAIVGRIDTWKGQDLFIDMAGILHERFPQARFEIFGESSVHDPKTVEFERMMKLKAQGADFIAFKGYRPTDMIYPNIDILIQASTKPEPFGRTIIEAMSYGIPVVASDSGGAREILTGDLKQFLVPPNSAEAFAEKVTEILNSEDMQQLFTQAAKSRIKDFELSKVASRITKIWELASKK